MQTSALGLSLIAIALLAIPYARSASFSVVKREVTEEESESVTSKDDISKNNVPPRLSSMVVNCNVSNRFAQTVVSSRFVNPSQNAQEATFAVVLPEKAYIAGFVMEIGNKSYDAYVREKEEAKKEYQQAVHSGFSAGHVAVSARDSNRFTVSVNVEPLSKVTFNLSYEQLLERKEGLYDLVINLHPGQPVKDLHVEVKISESRPLVNLKTPPLRSGNEIGDGNPERDPRAEIITVNETAAIIKFSPSIKKQKEFAKSFGTRQKDGLAGQFVVQYDVEREPHGGEILLNDGYFVHFFSPSELKPLLKHVVFVLDISGSMWDRKMAQLKQAMDKILSDLHPGDLFNLVQFESNVKVWNLENPEKSPTFPTFIDYWHVGEHNQSVKDLTFPGAYAANKENILHAKNIVSNLSATGGTNIYDALQVALRLVETEETSSKMQPIIMFLTDGDPTVGITNTKKIVSKVVGLNDRPKPAALFTLSFGDGADKEFLRKLALGNSGFSRHIYEAADATLQLEDFYRQISSPLLSKVQFKYSPNVVTSTLTKIDFPILFSGSELVVSGKYDTTSSEAKPMVSAWGINGPIDLIPKKVQSVAGLERLWAYLSIQQLMDKRETAENKTEIEKKALDLALRYSFVTPVSSLVVVKPNATTPVQTEAAKPEPTGYPSQRFYLSAAVPLYHVPQPAPAQSFNYGSYSSSSMQPMAGSGLAGPSGASYDLATKMRPIYATTTMIATDVRIAEFAEDEDEFAVDMDGAMPESYSPTTAITLQPKLDELSWLSAIKNTNNDTITLSSGNYPLGSNSTTTHLVNCTLPITENRTTSTPGICTLIKNCPVIYEELSSLDVYLNYFCEIEGYAGVCCLPTPLP